MQLQKNKLKYLVYPGVADNVAKCINMSVPVAHIIARFTFIRVHKQAPKPVTGLALKYQFLDYVKMLKDISVSFLAANALLNILSHVNFCTS